MFIHFLSTITVNFSYFHALTPINSALISSESFLNKSKTIFSSVRFGNVLQTRGSILPRVENQIKQGGPITLTDKRMRRFFMTKSQSVELILKAAEYAKGGETFVLKMPLIVLNDLFDVMKELIAPNYNLNPSKIKTKIIGIRPGEKITEYLLTSFELEHVLETKDFFIIPSMFESSSPKKYRNAQKPKNIKDYFKNQKPISKVAIKKMLKDVY